MPTMLIVGASSDIAYACALAFGAEGWLIEIAGRDDKSLSAIADDLSIRLNQTVAWHHFDAQDAQNRLHFWDELIRKPEAILIAVGLLGDQNKAQTDSKKVEEIITANFSGLLPLLDSAANYYQEQKSGLIIGISSVAADRGRGSNYIYGSAKAALTTYLSGLRNRLASRGVQVLTVKPGFVRTAMTEGLQLPPLLTATPEKVAGDVLEAVKKKKEVIYSRWFWRWIMLVIKIFPEKIFKKMKL